MNKDCIDISSVDRVPKFVEKLNSDFLEPKKISFQQLCNIKNEISQQNCENDLLDHLWTLKTWDHKWFNFANLPVKIGILDQKTEFSCWMNDQGLRFLDLPVFIQNQGWQIPAELEQFKEMIQKVVNHHRILVPSFESFYNVYITVDQGFVSPSTTQRRKGAHSDSYIRSKISQDRLIDYVYVASDCCPTEFSPGPFSFDGVDVENINQVLDYFAQKKITDQIKTYPSYSILRLDPYVIHDAGMNYSQTVCKRTFVKISFSCIKYCHLGNLRNPWFKYDWPLCPRNVTYTKEAMKESDHRPDRDDFREVNTSLVIPFVTKKSVSLDWCEGDWITCIKNQSVQAEKAKEGQVLETFHDRFLTTINVACEGDWKISIDENDQYFMSDNDFKRVYYPDPLIEGRYIQNRYLRRALKLSRKVRCRGPWQTMQYADAGDYLIYLHQSDIYFVPQKLFLKTFEIVQ